MNDQSNSTDVVPAVPAVERLGNWKDYDSQIDIPEMAGARIVKCLYQVNKETGKKVRESQWCYVPVAHITEATINVALDTNADLVQHVVNWLQSVEDKMIKADHSKGMTNLFVDGLSLQKLIDYLEEQEAGQRLNKQQIEEWFDQEISDHLTVLFAAKMGIDDNSEEQELAKLELILGAYKAKFASLASGKTTFKEEDCDSMMGVISAVEKETGTATSLGERFLNRLEKIRNKEVDTLISL